MRRRGAFSTLWVIGLVLFMGFAGGLLGPPPASAQARFRLAVPEDALSVDPIASSDNPSIWLQLLLYDQLVRPSGDGKSVIPGLAERWTISPDGKEYVFTLREAKFANGQKVSAKDVAFSLKRAGGDKSRWARFFRPIRELVAVDDRTVKLTLSAPFTPMMANLGLFSASILPADLVEKDEAEFFSRPIGSGPFVVERWSKGDRTILKKNPHYWQTGKPALDEVELQIVGEDNSRMLKIQAGEVDAALGVPFNMVSQLNARSDLKAHMADVFRIEVVLLNTKRKPFDDVRVRRALNHAVDKDGIIRTILFGQAKVAKSSLPIMTHYNDELQPYAYDLGRAKQLLTEAGYANGFSAELLVSSGDVTYRQVAAVIQDSLRKVGVNVTLKLLEGGTQFTTSKGGHYDMSLSYASSDTIDPDQLIGFTAVNPERANAFHTEWRSDRVNQLYEMERAAPEGAQRGAMFKEMQAIVNAEAPFIFLYHKGATYAVRNNVQGFRVLPTSNYRLEDVRLVK